MSAEWHYYKDGERAGPVSEEKLKQLVQEGRFLRTDKLWKDGMANWTDAVAGLPALFAAQPPPLPTEAPASPASLIGRALKLVLDEKWQEFLDDAWKAWRATSVMKKSLVVLIVVMVLSITLWGWIARAKSPTGEEPGFWSRLWDSGVITGCAGLVFAFLKRKLESPGQALLPSGEAGFASPIVEDGYLGLSRQQWLALLVALFIPTLLASLVSSFLVGSQVHLWLTGPLLFILGTAVSVLSVELNKKSQKNDLAIGVMVGGSALILYALTCINTPWVLLFYTLVVIFPTLHLFTVARQGAPPFRLSASLLTGFGVIGLTLALGITALPRSATDRDESGKLVGTWLQTGGGSAFRQPTLTFTKGGTVSWGQGGDSEWVAKFKFSGKTLTIYEDRSFGNKTEYNLDLVSDSEMLLGQADERSPFGGFSVMKGRWSKSGSPGGTKAGVAGGSGKLKHGDPKPGPRDVTSAEPPKLDSPLAPKLVGRWEGVAGKTQGHAVAFTKSGKVEFVYPDRRNQGRTETVLGSYSFKKDALLKIDEAGALSDDDGWQVEVEFLSDDEILLVNHRLYSGFGHLAGRYKRMR